MNCHAATLLAETMARLYAPRPVIGSLPSLRPPPRLCDPHPVFASAAKQSTSQTARCSTMDCRVTTLLAMTRAVFASAAKQSTSQTARCPTMDCHLATLLAETALHRLPRPTASQRQKRVLANPTCLGEHHPVFASAAKQSTSQTARYPTMDCRVATLLAETVFCHCDREERGGKQSTFQTTLHQPSSDKKSIIMPIYPYLHGF